MATKKSQRIAIWVIAVVMFVGTIGSFFVIILQNNNAASDQERTQAAMDAYQKDYEAYQNKVKEQDDDLTARTDALSAQYFEEFSGYSGRVGEFNKDDVKELAKEDLKVGEGKEVTADSHVAMYYIGWTPNGEIFDGSIEDGKLKTPFIMRPGSVIEGWTEGLQGMKIGGVREITIPSEKAYGEAGSGEKIPANTPLKFVVMAVEMKEAIAQPAVPQELMNYYGGY